MLFQTLIAGDSWGTCAVPVIHRNHYTFVIFAAVVMSVQVGFMNLILTVIVDCANEAKEKRDAEKQKEMAAENCATMDNLLETIRRIDADGMGTISREELLDGFNDDTSFRQLAT